MNTKLETYILIDNNKKDVNIISIKIISSLRDTSQVSSFDTAKEITALSSKNINSNNNSLIKNYNTQDNNTIISFFLENNIHKDINMKNIIFKETFIKITKATKFVCTIPFVLINALKNNNVSHNNNNMIKYVNEIFFFLKGFSDINVKSINSKKIVVAFFINKADLDLACNTEIETYELRDKKFKFKLIDLYAEYDALN